MPSEVVSRLPRKDSLARQAYVWMASPFIAAGAVLLVLAPRAAAWLLPVMGALVVLVPPPGAHLRAALRPAGAWRFFVALGIYVLLSAIWSADRQATLVTGLIFALFLLCAQLAIHGLAHEENAVIDRLARGLLAAFLVAAAIIAIEVSSDSPIHRTLFGYLPMLGPQGTKFMRLVDGVVEFLSPAVLNRTVAILNILAWPTLLVLRARIFDRSTMGYGAAAALLLVTATFASEHETSKAALICAVLVWLVYRASARAAQILITAGWIAASVLIVPAAQLTYSSGLHMAAWLPVNARARVILWSQTASEIANRPLFGVGAAATKTLDQQNTNPEQRPGHVYPMVTGPHAHDIYLQTWYELGLAGVVLLVLCGLSVLNAIWRLSGAAQEHAACLFVTLAVIGAFSWGMWQPWFMATWMMAAVFFVLAREYARRRPATPLLA